MATAAAVAQVEQGFHDRLAASLPTGDLLDATVRALRAVVADGPAGRALARRRGMDDTADAAGSTGTAGTTAAG
ncbi:hypothetical protein [Cellulomonas hominis]